MNKNLLGTRVVDAHQIGELETALEDRVPKMQQQAGAKKNEGLVRLGRSEAEPRGWFRNDVVSKPSHDWHRHEILWLLPTLG